MMPLPKCLVTCSTGVQVRRGGNRPRSHLRISDEEGPPSRCSDTRRLRASDHVGTLSVGVPLWRPVLGAEWISGGSACWESTLKCSRHFLERLSASREISDVVAEGLRDCLGTERLPSAEKLAELFAGSAETHWHDPSRGGTCGQWFMSRGYGYEPQNHTARAARTKHEYRICYGDQDEYMDMQRGESGYVFFRSADSCDCVDFDELVGVTEHGNSK
jgi:hypothetical protein